MNCVIGAIEIECHTSSIMRTIRRNRPIIMVACENKQCNGDEMRRSTQLAIHPSLTNNNDDNVDMESINNLRLSYPTNI